MLVTPTTALGGFGFLSEFPPRRALRSLGPGTSHSVPLPVGTGAREGSAPPAWHLSEGGRGSGTEQLLLWNFQAGIPPTSILSQHHGAYGVGAGPGSAASWRQHGNQRPMVILCTSQRGIQPTHRFGVPQRRMFPANQFRCNYKNRPFQLRLVKY